MPTEMALDDADTFSPVYEWRNTRRDGENVTLFVPIHCGIPYDGSLPWYRLVDETLVALRDGASS